MANKKSKFYYTPTVFTFPSQTRHPHSISSFIHCTLLTSYFIEIHLLVIIVYDSLGKFII